MKPEDSYDLTRVGPGTVMGDFMRQYWMPAMLSSELEVDGDPMRIMLLCEKLVAFRDSEGRVGILDQRCPHRCAALFLGRNEESGIRCVYHGWKFDVDGNCLEMPNVPVDYRFEPRVKAKAYKTHEMNGIIWVYMGPDQATPPPLPHIEAAMDENAETWCLMRDCNWLQALEGDIDTSHVGFLHVGSLELDDIDDDHPMRPTILNRAPEYKVQPTDWGVMYGGFRENDDGQMSWRVAHYMFPFWTQTPNNRFHSRAIARAWVPIDDEHSMLFDITCGSDEGNPAYKSRRKTGELLFDEFEYAPNGTGFYDRWRCVDDAKNDWGIDRESQRNGTQYTGIANITMQDQAVTESMGAITDHMHERLAPSDAMVSRTRRQALTMARAFKNEGKVPPGVENPEVYYKARAGSFLHNPEAPLDKAYEAALEKAERYGHTTTEPAE